MRKKMKITYAGRMRRVSIYTPPLPCDPQRVRGAKQRVSREAQKIQNRRHSVELCEDRLAENFEAGDLWICLTYREGDLPASRSAAETRLKKWMADVRAYCRARHLPAPRMMWCTEEKHGDGRLHHHVAITAWPNCYKVLRSLWRWGDDFDVKKIRVDAEKNYQSLARYMCKEEPKGGKHQWHFSRNCGAPETVTRWVDGREMIRPPKGSLIFASGTLHETQFGASAQYAVYLLPLTRARRGRK